MKRILVIVFALMAVASFAYAQEPVPQPAEQYPLISKQRLQIGARVEYAWWQQREPAGAEFTFKKELGVGIPASYTIVPNISLTWRTIYFIDNRIWSHAAGINFLIYNGRNH